MSDKEWPLVDMSVDRRKWLRETAPAIIGQVKGDEQSQWGIMTPHHMLEHLVLPLRFLTGEIVPPLFTPAEKIPRMQEFLYSPRAMAQGFKFPLLPAEETIPLETASLEDAKDLLNSYILRFLDVLDGEEFDPVPHPIFGPLDREGWLLFQYKHFCHHFSQFGLLRSN